MQPRVSIILPTRDRAALIGDAVASVQRQTYGSWELVVVDDGSTDGTAAVIRALSEPRLRYLEGSGYGSPTAARIAGVAAARAEWLAFLDSDDVWLPGKLAAQLEALSARPECRWSFTAFGVVDLGLVPVPGAHLARSVPSGRILEALLREDTAAALTTLLVSRRAFDAVGGFDPSLPFRGDLDLALRLAARFPAAGVAAPYTLVRVHSGRSTSALPPGALFRYGEAVYFKAERAAPSRAARRLCRRHRARLLAGWAGAEAAAGNRSLGLRLAMRAIALAPAAGPGWRALGRVLAGHRGRHAS